MRWFSAFVERHTLLFYVLLVLVLALLGLALTGDPLAVLRDAAGDSLRPIGETR